MLAWKLLSANSKKRVLLACSVTFLAYTAVSVVFYGDNCQFVPDRTEAFKTWCSEASCPTITHRTHYSQLNIPPDGGSFNHTRTYIALKEAKWGLGETPFTMSSRVSVFNPSSRDNLTMKVSFLNDHGGKVGTLEVFGYMMGWGEIEPDADGWNTVDMTLSGIGPPDARTVHACIGYARQALNVTMFPVAETREIPSLDENSQPDTVSFLWTDVEDSIEPINPVTGLGGTNQPSLTSPSPAPSPLVNHRVYPGMKGTIAEMVFKVMHTRNTHEETVVRIERVSLVGPYSALRSPVFAFAGWMLVVLLLLLMDYYAHVDQGGNQVAEDVELSSASLIEREGQLGEPKIHGKHVQGLDFLRFVAAVHIVSLHFYYQYDFTSWGESWVGFFFCVSGFVNTHARLWGRNPSETPKWRSFMYRRLMTFYPLFALSVVLLLLHSWTGQFSCRWQGFCVPGWACVYNRVNVPSWFVSALMPCLALFIPTYHHIRTLTFTASLRLLILTFVMSLTQILAIRLGIMDETYLRYHPLSKIHLFIAGMLCARLHYLLSHRTHGTHMPFTVRYGASISIVALTHIFLSGPTFRPLVVGSALTAKNLAVQGVLLPLHILLVLGLSAGVDPILKVFTRWPLPLGGQIAYQIYILQELCWEVSQKLSREFLKPEAEWLITDNWVLDYRRSQQLLPFVTLLISTAAYLWFDKPLRKYFVG